MFGGIAAIFLATLAVESVPNPVVRFVHTGRYLPPAGERTVEIEAVNTTNLETTLYRVMPQNIVQLLAREERMYGNYWQRDGVEDDTVDLSCEITNQVIKLANRTNEKHSFRIPIVDEDGDGKNGIYLLKASPGNEDWVDKYRLICISDLGLSVRRCDEDTIGVWVMSLLKGSPIKGARVSAYSAQNVKIMEGVTNEDGWCKPTRIAKGNPFVVVVTSSNGDDMTFMALKQKSYIAENVYDRYLAEDGIEAYIWTDRGIYRHGENIFMQALVRNGKRVAPEPMPLEIVLEKPDGKIYKRITKLTDEYGSIAIDELSVPDEEASGVWRLSVRIPGKGMTLGNEAILIEEFTPPQIRVRVELPNETTATCGNFTFNVFGEHLFGGVAKGMKCQGAIAFEDTPFSPKGWEGWYFGNEDASLKPNFTRIENLRLDDNGKVEIAAAMKPEIGKPKAAVMVTAQGTVIEDGGRGDSASAKMLVHYYPYYIGSNLDSWVHADEGMRPEIELACVSSDGARLATEKTLIAKVERVDTIYNYQSMNRWTSWQCEQVRTMVGKSFEVHTSTNGNTKIELPITKCGDYVLTVSDPEAKVSYAKQFYLSNYGDAMVRAPLSTPGAITIECDKKVYRPGDIPRLLVKAPFTGNAMMSVSRDRERYTEFLTLTNATSEVVLKPVTREDAPNLNVFISLIQSAGENSRHLAVRSRGEAQIAVRPKDEELAIDLKAELNSPKELTVSICAAGAEKAHITVVDEGIHILTNEQIPKPYNYFMRLRSGNLSLYDIYDSILPIFGEDALRASGVKTGGGMETSLLNRLSPVTSRRFKPLSLWSGEVSLSDGRGDIVFKLPEFAGEVRVTAVAYSAKACGSKALQRKITPKLVMLPDAPRFVAPEDCFDITLPIYNRSGEAAEAAVEIRADAECVLKEPALALADDASTNITVRVRAPREPGEMTLIYRVTGMGEQHEKTLYLPVRPAVAWRETAGVTPESEWVVPTNGRWTAKIYDNPMGEYSHALEWLADYPHGCLEQTTSRAFPLLGAGDLLSGVTSNGAEYISFAVKRVESMLKYNGFTAWPDCEYSPWDMDVSNYAMHFLVEADLNGYELQDWTKRRILDLLQNWAGDKNLNVAAYACHTLTIAGFPCNGEMYSLYDKRERLSFLSRARLARAFIRIGEVDHARTLLKNVDTPCSVKEAAFMMVALLELDAKEPRILSLLEYLIRERDRATYAWGTTESNAHALWAIGAYFRNSPLPKNTRLVAWKKLELPSASEVWAESNGIMLQRRILTTEGKEADLGNLHVGDLVNIELSISVPDDRVLSDLVVEDLFSGAMEPIFEELKDQFWILRTDIRDDRALVFSTRFNLERGRAAKFMYPMRVVSAGEFILPGTSVEGMYLPNLRARLASTRIVVHH